MRKSDLTKKIGQGLGILALSTFIGSGICYAKETNPKGYEIPDLSNAKLVGKIYQDLTDKIEGPEALHEVYELNKEGVRYACRESINGKVFLYSFSEGLYGITDPDNPHNIILKSRGFYGIADLDGDGIFETKYSAEELEYTDRITGDYPAKKDLPPEWALK